MCLLNKDKGIFSIDRPLQILIIILLMFLSFLSNAIVLFRPKHLKNKFEADTVVYDGKDSKEELESWINTN